MDATEIERLGGGRWTVPLLAHMAGEDRGARFATMLACLGIARDSLTRTLAYCIESGWIMRNPGHGHPLRPEYVLTPRGAPIATACRRMMATRARLNLPPDSLPRWSLPILTHLADDWRRFSDLRAALAPVTPRALSQNLKQMTGARLVARRLVEGFPPGSLYGLGPPGVELLASLRA